MTTLRHYDHLGHIRFITFSTYKRLRLLTHPEARDAIVKSLSIMREIHNVDLFGYVVMPNHLHLLLRPKETDTLNIPLRSFKIATTRAIFSNPVTESFLADFDLIDSSGHRRLWQKRGFDHNCRNEEAFVSRLKYCHENPVKAGLASRASDWKWSSAAWYEGDREVELKMDCFK